MDFPDKRLQDPVRVGGRDHIYASATIAADKSCNIAAEAKGPALAVRPGTERRPIPNTRPQSEENRTFNGAFSASRDGAPPAAERWTSGPFLDGGAFGRVQTEPMGEEPGPGRAHPRGGAPSQPIG